MGGKQKPGISPIGINLLCLPLDGFGFLSPINPPAGPQADNQLPDSRAVEGYWVMRYQDSGAAMLSCNPCFRGSAVQLVLQTNKQECPRMRARCLEAGFGWPSGDLGVRATRPACCTFDAMHIDDFFNLALTNQFPMTSHLYQSSLLRALDRDSSSDVWYIHPWISACTGKSMCTHKGMRTSM